MMAWGLMASSGEQVATSIDVQTAAPSRFRLMPMPRFSALSRRRGTAVAGSTATLLPGTTRRRGLRLSGGLGLVVSLLIMVIAPAGLSGYYYGVVASDIYVSEAKFAVRGTVEHLPKSTALEMFSPLTAMNSNQDAFIVASYIDSLPLIDKVQRSHDIRSVYSRPEIDPVARLDAHTSAEGLRKYWNKKVTATIDNLSGVVTLHVAAFTPSDALAISKTVLVESERLVNDISRRKNADSVDFARDEVTRAEKRVETARLAMQDFRNQSGQVDPGKQAEATLKLAMVLRTERIALENELSAARSNKLSETSPSIQVLNARLAGAKDRIAEVDRTLTGDSRDQRTTAALLYRYEGLELERMFAEKVYAMAQTAYERARITADRQNLYLVTFVQPGLAQLPLLPRRGAEILVICACAFAIWSVCALVVAAVKDHNA